jgi:hypothetical protein
MRVPGLRAGAAIIPFHSLYDPTREAQNLSESLGDDGCFVMLGLGSGHLVRKLLERSGTYSIVIVERSAAVLRALVDNLPFEDVLADPRVSVIVDLDGVQPAILASWRPVLMAGIRSVPLRPWCEAEPDFFREAGTMVQAAIESTRADYGVQAHFGKRWMANILANLEPAQSLEARPKRILAARITAAGPSLDLSLEMLRDETAQGALLATDTTLPTLLRSGIVPDAIISIDCQNHGFRHFVPGLPPSALLVLDLASPAPLARLSRNTLFIRSGHPFVSYASALWKKLPAVDTSGGNVTQAAISLANEWGAGSIHLYGADFSYPNGKSYARGTYMYDYFQMGENRFSPLEAGFYSFLFRSTDFRRERIGAGWRYESELLTGYRDRLVAMMRSLDSQVNPIPGLGLPIPRWDPPAPIAPANRPGSDWEPSSPFCDWKDFLSGYAEQLAALSGFSSNPARYFAQLSDPHRQLWNTILPVAARCSYERDGPPPGPDALETAREWVIARARRTVESSL